MKATFYLFLLLTPLLMKSQSSSVVTTEKLKLVIQMTSADTTVHKGLMKQINNFLQAAPNSKIEVVCHSAGIEMLTARTSTQAEKIKMYVAKGVDFVGCENSMKDRNLSKEDLVVGVRTVPAGMVEIVQKQNKKWAYIKAGH